jgi:hypothetical protein
VCLEVFLPVNQLDSPPVPLHVHRRIVSHRDEARISPEMNRTQRHLYGIS